MKSRILRAFPVVCLFVALALFVAFHFLPPLADFDRLGWRIWKAVWQTLIDPESIMRRPDEAVFLASFLTMALLVPTSPFLLPVLRKSRLAWLILLIASLLAALGLGFTIIIMLYGREIELFGFWFLLLANILNFLGLATARLGIRFVTGDPHGFAGNREREILPESGNPENFPK